MSHFFLCSAKTKNCSGCLREWHSSSSMAPTPTAWPRLQHEDAKVNKRTDNINRTTSAPPDTDYPPANSEEPLRVPSRLTNLTASLPIMIILQKTKRLEIHTTLMKNTVEGTCTDDGLMDSLNLGGFQ